jgi:uncharacterized membrane protein
MSSVTAWAHGRSSSCSSRSWRSGPGYNGNHGFDPYPFILLNLFLSLLAGLQGAILLIAAKRADSNSSEVAMHTLDNTTRLKQLIEANTNLTQQISDLTAKIHQHMLAEPA